MRGTALETLALGVLESLEEEVMMSTTDNRSEESVQNTAYNPPALKSLGTVQDFVLNGQLGGVDLDGDTGSHA